MLRLHFPNRNAADVPLADGVCPVVRHASGQILAGVSAVGMLLLARFCVDRRGIWLQVSDDGSRVHVNGRPVRRMAWVRPGDRVNVDGTDIQVLGRHPGVAATAQPELAVLRAHGGRLHGRAFALQRSWVMGSSSEADIVLADAGVPPLFVRVHPAEGQVRLQVLPAEGQVLLNGEAVREAVMLPGDQLCLPGNLRFVLEAPDGGIPAWQPAPAADVAPVEQAAPGKPAQGRFNLVWMLVAALGMAGLLAALLLFGPR